MNQRQTTNDTKRGLRPVDHLNPKITLCPSTQKLLHSVERLFSSQHLAPDVTPKVVQRPTPRRDRKAFCYQSRIQQMATAKMEAAAAKMEVALIRRLALENASDWTMHGNRPVTAPVPVRGKAAAREMTTGSACTRHGPTDSASWMKARHQRPVSAPEEQLNQASVLSAMHRRAIAYASQCRQPGQVTGDRLRQPSSHPQPGRRPATAPLVFASGNPMINGDFYEQVLSVNAQREVMLRQPTNVPRPKPKQSHDDAALHPMYMHSFNKCPKYVDNLRAELAQQRLLRDHRQPSRASLPMPDYDDHNFPYYRTRGSSRLGETNPQLEMCFFELVKNRRLHSACGDGGGEMEEAGQADKDRDPQWLTPRVFTAPPRRAPKLPVTQQREKSAPVYTEPSNRKEMPMPPNWKDSYGRPTHSAFLRWQSIATSRPNMTLQRKERMCVEFKRRMKVIQTARLYVRVPAQRTVVSSLLATNGEHCGNRR